MEHTLYGYMNPWWQANSRHSWIIPQLWVSFLPNSTHRKYLNVYKHLDDYLAINTFSLRSLGMSPVMFNRSSRSPLNCVWKAPNCVIAPKINRYPTLSLLVLIVSIYSGHSTLTTCVVMPQDMNGCLSFYFKNCLTQRSLWWVAFKDCAQDVQLKVSRWDRTEPTMIKSASVNIIIKGLYPRSLLNVE